MAGTLEFYFDLSSPWTRIAFHNVVPLVQDTGARISWHPFLVGGVFNAVNQQVYESRADPTHPRVVRSFEWMKEWADLAGVAMNFPAPHHPLKSVNAMRFCCVLEPDQGALYRFAEAAFEAYFGGQRNLDDMEVLIDIATGLGMPGEALAQQAVSDANKLKLRQNTQQAIDRGAFGSPTMFVNGEHMYFGNDQLPLVRQRLLQG